MQISKEYLDELRNVDIRTVNANSLVDIDTVEIKNDMPVKERVLDYIEQIKNPYCYKSHGVIVKISFAGKSRFEDCLKVALFPNVEI